MNATTTWRDYSDRLTPEQVEDLADTERAAIARGCPADAPELAQTLLGFARVAAEGNEADEACAGIPLPAGVSTAGDWMKWDDGTWIRTFEVSRHGDGQAGASVDGLQSNDGTVTYDCRVASAASLSAVEARRLAVALMAAADVVDRLTGVDPPFM